MTGITCSVDDGVLTVTIDRPHVRNAMDRAAAEALATALDELDGDPSLSVGILTGANGWFCAGMDLKAFARDGERPLSAGRGAFGIVERPPVKPLIAAVEGSALGGGLEIVLACDLVVASRTAQFGLPEVRRGLVAAAGGLLRLPRRVCRSRALELALLGDPCPAERAADWGLVNWLCEPGEALATASAVAARIAANAPLAVRTSKQLVDDSVDWSQSEWFDLQKPYTRLVRQSRDAVEGATAFAEGRRPEWQGR